MVSMGMIEKRLGFIARRFYVGLVHKCYVVTGNRRYRKKDWDLFHLGAGGLPYILLSS